MVNNCRFKH